RAGKRDVLPGPRLSLLIIEKAVDLRRQRAGAARGTQPHVDLIKRPVVGARRQCADQALREPRKVLRAIERAPAVGLGRFGTEVVHDDQVEIGGRGHLAPAELSQRQYRGLLIRYPAVHPREFVLGRAMKRTQQHIRQPRKRLTRLLRRYGSREDAGADQEHLLLREGANTIEKILMPGRLTQRTVERTGELALF